MVVRKAQPAIKEPDLSIGRYEKKWKPSKRGQATNKQTIPWRHKEKLANANS